MSHKGSEIVTNLYIPYRRLYGEGIPLPAVSDDTLFKNVITEIRFRQLFFPKQNPRSPYVDEVDTEISLLNSREQS